VSFSDSLFLTVSAMTLAGLNTINLSTLNSFQQVLLFLLIMLGSAIFVSAFVVHVRRRAFDKKFVVLKERERIGRGERVKTWASTHLRGRSRDDLRDQELATNGGTTEKTSRSVERRDETPPARRGGPEMNGISAKTGERIATDLSDGEAIDQTFEEGRDQSNPGITFREDTRFGQAHENHSQPPQPVRRRHSGVFSMQGVGARPLSSLDTTTSLDLQSFPSLQRTRPAQQATASGTDISRYFDTATGWVARNSQFHGLTEEERERLGGCEYRAVSLLEWLVPVYFVMWQLFGCIGCAAWVALNMPDTAWTNGIDPWWVGAFNAVSAFNNSGMSLLDANMVAFQRSYYLLLTMGLLILAGNTCYPVFLRLIIWCMLWITQHISRQRGGSDLWETRATTLKFLLDHPRRCYTNLFPAQHTWWLALSVFTLNGIDWAMFEILNIGNVELKEGLPTRYQVIDGLFQGMLLGARTPPLARIYERLREKLANELYFCNNSASGP